MQLTPDEDEDRINEQNIAAFDAALRKAAGDALYKACGELRYAPEHRLRHIGALKFVGRYARSQIIQRAAALLRFAATLPDDSVK